MNEIKLSPYFFLLWRHWSSKPDYPMCIPITLVLSLPSSMADSSKIPTSLEDAILKLTAHQLSLGETLQIVTLQLDEILHCLLLAIANSAPAFTPSASSPTPAITHRIKLNAPCFDGTDPLGWIFKITQFFEYHGTPEAERLIVASFYMDSRALAWFQWMSGNGQFTSWSMFL